MYYLKTTILFIAICINLYACAQDGDSSSAQIIEQNGSSPQKTSDDIQITQETCRFAGLSTLEIRVGFALADINPVEKDFEDILVTASNADGKFKLNLLSINLANRVAIFAADEHRLGAFSIEVEKAGFYLDQDIPIADYTEFNCRQIRDSFHATLNKE